MMGMGRQSLSVWWLPNQASMRPHRDDGDGRPLASVAKATTMLASMRPHRDDGDGYARADWPHGELTASMRPHRDDGDGTSPPATSRRTTPSFNEAPSR